MTSLPTPIRRRAILSVLLAAILSIGASLALTAVYGPEAWPELLLGCAAAMLNGIAHALISSRSVGSPPAAFLRWGIVTNALRIAVVLGTLFAVSFLTQMRLAPFALSLVAGTVVFLVCNAVVITAVGSAR